MGRVAPPQEIQMGKEHSDKFTWVMLAIIAAWVALAIAGKLGWIVE